MERITPSSASPGHISTMSLTSGLYCYSSIQTSHKNGLYETLAGSLDDQIFLYSFYETDDHYPFHK